MNVSEYLALEGIHTERNLSYLPQPNVADVVITPLEAPHELIPTAFCFAFRCDGSILMAQNTRRGLEVPGGHREIIDGILETPYETAKRETLEEIGAFMSDLNAVGFMRSTCLGSKPDGYDYPYPYSCQQFYVGRVTWNFEFTVTDECFEPVWVSRDQIEQHLSGRSLELYYAAYNWFMTNEI